MRRCPRRFANFLRQVGSKLPDHGGSSLSHEMDLALVASITPELIESRERESTAVIALAALDDGCPPRVVRCALASLACAPPSAAGAVLSHVFDLLAERAGSGDASRAEDGARRPLPALVRRLAALSRGACASVRATLVARRRFARAALALSVERLGDLDAFLAACARDRGGGLGAAYGDRRTSDADGSTAGLTPAEKVLSDTGACRTARHVKPQCTAASHSCRCSVGTRVSRSASASRCCLTHYSYRPMTRCTCFGHCCLLRIGFWRAAAPLSLLPVCLRPRERDRDRAQVLAPGMVPASAGWKR